MTKQYIGTKIIWAWREDRPQGEGYAVKYADGYTSWSPKDTFEEAYRETSGLTFGLAIDALKKGFKVARIGWNGKGMFLIHVPGTDSIEPRAGTPYADLLVSPTGLVTINGHIDMKTATGEMQPGWLASQTDMLAEDWHVVE